MGIAHKASYSELLENVGSAHPTGNRCKWSDLKGMAAYPMMGEDAQAWVTRTRQESDEHREQGLRISNGD